MLFYNIRKELPRWCRKRRFLSDYIEDDYRGYVSKIPSNNWFRKLLGLLLGSRVFVIVLLFLPLLLVVLSAALADTGYFLLVKNDFYSISTILATLSVVIVMGVVFSIESNRADFPGPGSLLQVLIRDYNFFPSIALVLGSVISGFIYPSIYYPLEHDLVSDLVFISLSALSFSALFLVLYNTFNSISKGNLYSLIADNFRNKHRLALREHVNQSLMISYLYFQIDDKSFSWNVLGVGSRAEHISYSLRANGALVDIDINRLNDAFTSHGNTSEDANKVKPTVRLAPLKDYGKDMVEAISFPEELNMVSSNVIEECFVWDAKYDRANPDWELLNQLISKSVATNNLSHFEKGLGLFFAIASEYLEVIPKLDLEHRQPTFLEKPFLSYSPPTLVAIDFHEIFLAAVRSENQKMVDECCRYLVKIAVLAWRHKSQSYYDDVLKLIVGLFLGANAPEVKNRLLETIKSIFEATSGRDLRVLMHSSKDETFDGKHIVEFYTTYLKSVLFLLKLTTKDIQLFERMYNELLWGLNLDDYERIVVTRFASEADMAVWTANKVHHFSKFARLVICAWVHFLIEQEQIRQEDEMDFEKAIGPLFRNLEEVAGLYLFRNHSPERVDAELGIVGWHKEEESEEGVYTHTMPDKWLLDYWFFIALHFAGRDQSVDKKPTLFSVDLHLYGSPFGADEFNRFERQLDKFIEANKGLKKFEGIDVDKSKACLLKIFRDIRDYGINRK